MIWMKVGMLGALALVAGCATTQQAKPTSVVRSGFLGDYSRLTPGDPSKGQALLRRIDTQADWKHYQQIIVDPVTYWGDDSGKLLPPDQQHLTNYMYTALTREFGKALKLVTTPGANTLRLKVAITEADSAVPVIRTVSLVVPQARAINTVKYVATGTWAGAGAAQIEARLTDAATGRVLGEWLDRRVGGSSLAAAAQLQWGDVQNAIDAWAAIGAKRVGSWTKGTAAPGESLGAE